MAPAVHPEDTLSKRLRILFLCTGNSCRSQMAEGWARQLKGDAVEPYSAGVEVKPIDPNAVTVMAEAGVDISGQRSKSVSEMMEIPYDYVVTVCSHARETCPFFPGSVKRLHVGSTTLRFSRRACRMVRRSYASIVASATRYAFS